MWLLFIYSLLICWSCAETFWVSLSEGICIMCGTILQSLQHRRSQRRLYNLWHDIYVCVYVCAQSLNCVQFFVTPWAIAHQVPLSMGFSRQEYWSGLPSHTPGHLPDPGNQTQVSCNLFIGKQILYYWAMPPGKHYDVLQSYWFP